MAQLLPPHMDDASFSKGLKTRARDGRAILQLTELTTLSVLRLRLTMRKATSPWALLLLPLLFLHAAADPESLIAPMEKTELEALYSVIQDLVGKWWNGSDLYPDPCGWTQIQGVSCDIFNGLWYVASLSVGPVLENSLECAEDAKFNPLLFQLKHLKSLSFYNCFSPPRPITMPSSNWEKLAGSLENLEFRSNRGLVGEIPPSLGQLSNLKSLVLVDNSFTGQMPTELSNLIHLKRLILSGNKLSGQLPASLFTKWTQLLILDLNRNFLGGPLPSSLCNLSSLLKLDLSNNQFTGGLPPELGNLRQLTLLDLRNNNLSGGSPKSLPGMASLEDLLLSHNPWSDDLVEFELENLRNLTTLDLSHMGLTGTIPEAIVGLKRLRYLALDNNHLSGSVSPKFASLASLTAFYLNGNNLTGKLEFPPRFYQKMGKRFASWNNPSLCYNAVAAGNAPFGVAQCKVGQEEPPLENSSSNKATGLTRNPDENSGLMASSWFPAASVSGLWWGIVVQEVVVMLLLIMLL